MSRKFAYALKIIALLNYNEKILERKNHDCELYHNVCSKIKLGLTISRISKSLGCSAAYVSKVKKQELGS